MHYRQATRADAAVLARMNHRLIHDEGHRNPMSTTELAARMEEWLEGSYEAVLFEEGQTPVGYALYRREPDHVYLRQFFVEPSHRRCGVGRAAIAWLRENAWSDAARVRLDVLFGNHAAIAFWRSVGFVDYCLTMEIEPPSRTPGIEP